MTDYHIFFFGGTGIRVAQALVFACAYGLLNNSRLYLTVLDTDKGASFDKLKETVEDYQHLHQRWKTMRNDPIKQNHASSMFPLFGAEIKHYEPLPYYLANRAPGTLRDELSTKTKTKAEYTVLHGILGDDSSNRVVGTGLYANPAVGAYLLREEMEADVALGKVANRPDQNEKVALCASSFGGTGVAAAEVMLREFGENGTWHKKQMKVKAFLIQPYFSIKPGEAETEHWDEGEAENRHAEVKRHYGLRRNGDVQFIGSAYPERWMRGEYKDHDQENLPDLTEWVAAIEIAAWLQKENKRDIWSLRADMQQTRERFYELAVIWTKRFHPTLPPSPEHKKRFPTFSPMFYGDIHLKCDTRLNKCPAQENCRHQENCLNKLNNFLLAFYRWHRKMQTKDFTDASELFDAATQLEITGYRHTSEQFEHGKKLWSLAASKGCDGMEDLFSNLFYALGRMV